MLVEEGPLSHVTVSFKKREINVHVQRTEGGGGDWGHVSTSQGAPGVAGRHQSLRETRTDAP